MQRIAAKYTSWPSEHFRTWTEADFERYYPERFSAEIDTALAKTGQEKRKAKEALLSHVKRFCLEHSDEARSDFEMSAAEIISVLQEIADVLFNSGE